MSMFRKKLEQPAAISSDLVPDVHPVVSFVNCAHKQVVPRYDVNHLVGVELDCPVTEDDELRVEASALALLHVNGMRYHEVSSYNVLEDYNERAEYTGLDAAYRHLARSAAEVACKGCVYPQMTPLAVSDMRADKIEEQLTLAINDERIVAAKVALQERHASIAAYQAQLDADPTI